ncbi:MAG TPA: DUF4199 domain-containing protein [Ignavibacteria bacterium]|mgnify:FL=1|nr:DUF4199 domain-containing protein [Ignavibacteria bacterium]HMQ99637.1 DUF4199 domain-containing protein [Ignavibacteria bacterium]
MKKNSLVFGLISGVIISTFMGISMAIISCGSGDADGGTSSMIIGFSAMAVAFSFIFVGIKNFRDKKNCGAITFSKAFLLGFLISLIASTLYVITWGIEFHFFMPEFIDKYSAMQIKELQNSGITGQALEEGIKSIETTNYNYKNNILFFAMYTYAEILPVGILITLISSLILRRKKTEPVLQ